jgi:glycosyltransferase involved in cell wall biosynthesis
VTILHVLEPFASGVTTAVISIITELSDLRHIVIHGARNWVEDSGAVKKRFPPGVDFVEWKSAGREISLPGDFRALRELLSLLKPYAPGNAAGRSRGYPAAEVKTAEPVVVHLHSSKAGFLGRLACRLLGIRSVIYTPHCGAFLRTDIGPAKRKLYRFLEWIGGWLGGRVVGCGPSEGELYKKLGRNTTFVANGVTPRPPRTGSAGASGRAERSLVGFTGIASFQKDPALFSAVARICKSDAGAAGFLFYWIGDGPLEKELDRSVVTVTGWKGSGEVEKLLERTAVYLSCSAWEGLPYGALEAMNASCALLLRNVPGHRDLVAPGENGWLFDSAEEAAERLAAMLGGGALLERMGKRSREILESGFTLKRMGEGYRAVYAEAVSGAASKRRAAPDKTRGRGRI